MHSYLATLSMLLLLFAGPGLTVRAQHASSFFRRLSSDEGLSHSQVLSLLNDRDGFLWVGTEDGLNRYDGYRFKVWRHDANKQDGLRGKRVAAIAQDRQGRLWLGSNAGLECFDLDRLLFSFFGEAVGLPDVEVSALCVDPNGERLWVGTGKGLVSFDLTSQQFSVYPNGPQVGITALHWDDKAKDGGLWLGTKNGAVYHMNMDPSTFRLIPFADNGKARIVHALEVDRKGVLWVGTNLLGLCRLNPSGELVSFPIKTEDDNDSEPGTIFALAEDSLGRLWVGSWAHGLYRHDEKDDSFRRYKSVPSNPGSLSRDTVMCLLPGSSENQNTIWVGTEGGGLNQFDPEIEAFTYWNTGFGGDEHVLSILEDRLGILWMGTWKQGLIRIDPITHRRSSIGREQGLDSAMIIFLDEMDGNLLAGGTKGLYKVNWQSLAVENLVEVDLPICRYPSTLDNKWWIGTGGKGLFEFWPDEGRLEPSKILRNVDRLNVYCLAQAENGHFWMGTNVGLLLVHEQKGVVHHLRHEADRPDSLPHDSVLSIKPDPSDKSRLWLATRGGLSLFDTANLSCKSWLEGDGLPNDTVYNILFDEQQRLWVSTNNGLASFDPERQRFHAYTQRDGLPFAEFNHGAFNTPGGRLFFAGVRGAISFDPEDLGQLAQPPKTVLTDILVNYHSMSPDEVYGDGDHRIIQLDHRRRQLSLEFGTLDFLPSQRKTYAYTLEGKDRQWHYTSGDRRLATYTNLSPGKYLFKVKGTNRDGIWSDQTLAVPIRVHPAPWNSWWARAILLFLFLLFCWAVWRFQRARLERARAINEELNRHDKLKDQFLANTSHELRTPVHGIIGLTESLLSGAAGELNISARQNLSMIVASGRRLASLIDDILDFSKLEQCEDELVIEVLSPREQVDAVLALCWHLIGDKEIVLENLIGDELPDVAADINRVQQILINLVANAIKFTDRGRVEVTGEVVDGFVKLHVKDTGIGIPEDRHDTIFEAFRQAEGSTSRLYGGTGLGLSIARKLVGLHGGAMWVKSAPGEGSTFSFSLPIADASTDIGKAPAKSVTPVREPVGEIRSEPVALTVKGMQHHILIVDDDLVNRQVLLNHLTVEGYHVSQAPDGPFALELLAENHYDLVLLDVMMPHMSGLEVCRQLRERYSPAELPVIFLSARERDKDRLGGLEAGANDYLTKPVNREELLMRIRNQLRLLEGSRNLEHLVQRRTRELRETQEELVRTSHMAGMGEIAAEIMHGMGNAVNSLATSLQVLQDLVLDDKSLDLLKRLELWLKDTEQLEKRPPDPELLAEALSRVSRRISQKDDRKRDEMARLIEHADEIRRVLRQQQELAGEREKVEACDLSALVRTSLEMERELLQQCGISLIQELRPLQRVLVAPTRFSRVFLYLMVNAREAVIASGNQRGIVQVRSFEEEGLAVLEIQDNGTGFEQETVERLFCLGFTTKTNGSGFGLHYCANAVQEMGGTISLTSQGVGHGATVSLRFPQGSGQE